MSLLRSLPGIPTPVSEVTKALANMWQGETLGASPNEYHASQMNMILHLGPTVGEVEGRETFEIALRFAQRYPCRIIVLCPSENAPSSDSVLEGKLFSQCYIGSGHGEMSCCEALILGYHTGDYHFLEDQVSIWLESDLPVYHWFHGVPSKAVEERYLAFAKTCRRVVYDSCVNDPGYKQIPWPRKESVRDLAWARTLPLRQSVGQFLSGFAPAVLAKGLQGIRVTSNGSRCHEGAYILEWQRECIKRCLDNPELQLEETLIKSEDEDSLLKVEWIYSNKNKFSFILRTEAGDATIEADFGEGVIQHPMQIKFLRPEEALAETFFF